MRSCLRRTVNRIVVTVCLLVPHLSHAGEESPNAVTVYEPERGQFSWDGAEMRIPYRILDWCEKNRADVFLQQMWGNVAWNAFPEWRDDAVGRVHSGPASMEDFGEGLTTLVEHLVKEKGYTCIRWVCITNEPNGGWSRMSNERNVW